MYAYPVESTQQVSTCSTPGLDMWCLCMASVFSAFEGYTVDVFIRTWMFSNMASNHSWQFRRVSMCAPSYTIFSEYQQSVIIMCPFST